MLDNATIHKAKFSMAALEEVVGKWLITHGLWPPVFPDFNICNYYLLETLKDGVYVNKPH
jgi:hypothetical protein